MIALASATVIDSIERRAGCEEMKDRAERANSPPTNWPPGSLERLNAINAPTTLKGLIVAIEHAHETDPNAHAESEATRNGVSGGNDNGLLRSIIWTLVLVINLPFGFYLLPKVCELLIAARAPDGVVGLYLFTATLVIMTVSFKAATTETFETKRLKGWMVRHGEVWASFVVMAGLTLTAGAALLAKSIKFEAHEPTVQIVANVILLSLLFWAPLVAFRLKPVLDAYVEIKSGNGISSDDELHGR